MTSPENVVNVVNVVNAVNVVNDGKGPGNDGKRAEKEPWTRSQKLSVIVPLILAAITPLLTTWIRRSYFNLDKPVPAAIIQPSQIQPATGSTGQKSKPTPHVSASGKNSGAIGSLDVSGDCNAIVNGGSHNSASVNCENKAGNLKQRILGLCDEITDGMSKRDKFISSVMPNTVDGRRTEIASLSIWFRWKYLQKVRSIRDESAEIHVKSNDLDDYLKMEEIDATLSAAPKHRPMILSQYDYDRIIRGLNSLANELHQ